MDRIALFGAAGAIGGSIAAELQRTGAAYRVVGRGRAELERRFGSDPRAEIVTWNPDDPASVRAAARNIDTIFYLVGVPYWQFELHPQLIRKTLEGAIAGGVKRMVLIGTVYPFGRARTERVSEDHPREPNTFKGRMRKQQEDLLLAVDSAGSLRGTILRLPDFYGPNIERSYLASAFQAAIKGGRAQMVGPIDVPHEFMYVPDVGPVALALASEERAYGRAWHFGGPGAISGRAFVERVFQEAGRKPKYIVANKTVLRVMGLVSPLMREMVEMMYLFESPLIMDDSAIHGLLGQIKKTSYEDGIRETLRVMRAG
ncbi:MAG TPA: NAD-dependent epimerase/dehydratase family protein [Bryobacteraceae bacterium]|nr:NAD-dependent epimerase/dehydratase family protein [Bryobacteraceae bacterium]